MQKNKSKKIKSALLYYLAFDKIAGEKVGANLTDFMRQVLCHAKGENDVDIFMTTNTFDTHEFLKTLNFEITESWIYFHLYNWIVSEKIRAREIGVNFV